jgi:uncharacterized membrane protein
MDAQKENVSLSWISHILFVGSVCAAVVLALGLLVMWIKGEPFQPVLHVVRPSLSVLFSSLVKGEAAAILNLGILAMMLTPFLRVVVAVISFLWEKDYRYAAVAAGVGVILLFTIVPSFLR